MLKLTPIAQFQDLHYKDDEGEGLVDSIDFEQGNNFVTIRGGIDFNPSELAQFNADTSVFLLQVSTDSEEYVIKMKRKRNGGEIYSFTDGSTGQRVHFVSGLTGLVMKVDRRFVTESFFPITQPITEGFGEVMVGFVDGLDGALGNLTFNPTNIGRDAGINYNYNLQRNLTPPQNIFNPFINFVPQGTFQLNYYRKELLGGGYVSLTKNVANFKKGYFLIGHWV